MSKYVHVETTMGDILVTDDGMSVPCAAAVATMGVVFVRQSIEFVVDILRSHDEQGDFKRLIDTAMMRGRNLAASYIAARTAGPVRQEFVNTVIGEPWTEQEAS